MTPMTVLESSELYTPIALRLIDSVTGQGPIAPVTTILEAQTGPTQWTRQDTRPVTTPGGILTFPGLERRQRAPGPSRRYRVRFESDAYEADHRSLPLTADGIVFDSFPYNDDAPPAAYATQVTPVILHPSPRYPFEPSIHVLRGMVIRFFTTTRVAAAVVAEGLHDQTITDAAGEFALPLRQVTPGVNTAIDVIDRLSTPNETGIAVIVLPAALGISHTIAIA
jgi:hypothetical protein